MTLEGVLAGLGLVASVVGSVALILPAVRRSGLGMVHPALAWLVLHVVFFGVGATALAATGAIAPRAAWYIAGAAVATGFGVLGADRLARHRGAPGARSSSAVTAGTPDPAAVRPAIAIALLGLALAAVAPGLVATGLPLLADDPTGARTAFAGLVVQPLRVALPAAVIVVLVACLRRPSRRRVVAALAALGVSVAFTLLLASRYLAAELVLSVAVAWLLAGRRLDWRAIGLAAAATVIVFGAVQVVRAPERSSGRELAFALERTVSRVVLVQPRTLDALMDEIPARTPLFGGLTWLRRVGPLVGRDDVPNLGYWIYPRIFPDQDPGIRGYAAPGLIGEAWANLGLAGLALFAGLGVVLERFGALLTRRRTGTADIAAGAVVLVVLARSHALGLNGMLVLLALVTAWRLLAGGGARDLCRDVSAVVRWRA